MATLTETFTLPRSQAVEQKVHSPGQIAWRKLRRNRAAMFGLVLLLGLITYVVLGSFIYSEEYANHNDLSVRLQAPSAGHPFGTDPIGRDILARTIYGG